MSSPKSRLVAIAFLSASGFLPQAIAGEARCTAYHEDRVLYLLGCCGDLVANYPGPRFPDPMSEVQRATRALEEIGAARMLSCYSPRHLGAQALTLNGIAARLMRAQALAIRSASESDMTIAVADAETAQRELLAFTASYPALAARLWHWIAMSFRRSGHTWEALAFVVRLPKNCCEQSEIEVVEGDLCFELGIDEAASQHYTAWLERSSPDSLCGHSAALRNAAELRRLGFAIPSAPSGGQGICMAGPDWRPYVSLPDK